MKKIFLTFILIADNLAFSGIQVGTLPSREHPASSRSINFGSESSFHVSGNWPQGAILLASVGPSNLSVGTAVTAKVKSGTNDMRLSLQRALDDAGLISKGSLKLPAGQFHVYAGAETAALRVGYSSFDRREGVTSATRSEPFQEPTQFGSLLIEGEDCNVRYADTNNLDGLYNKGTVIVFHGLNGKVGIETGPWQSGVKFKNILFVGEGFNTQSIGVRVNTGTTQTVFDNCGFLNFGTAVDIGGDYLSTADAHADFTEILNCGIDACGVGIKVWNQNAYGTTIFHSRIGAFWCIDAPAAENAKEAPSIQIINSFLGPQNEYGGYLLTGTITGASESSFTITNLVRLNKFFTNLVSTTNMVAASMADVVTNLVVIADKDTVGVGTAKISDWSVNRRVTSINSNEWIIGVNGAVNFANVTNKTIYIARVAKALNGSGFKMIGGHSEQQRSQDFGFSPMFADLKGYRSTSSFDGVEFQYLSIDSAFNRMLAKVRHEAVYTFHGFPLKVSNCRVLQSFPKWQVDGSMGVSTDHTYWHADPLFIDVNGVMAEGVERWADSHYLKTGSDYIPGSEILSERPNLGSGHYEVINGLLKRRVTTILRAPTKGTSGELFFLDASPTVPYRIGDAPVPGFYDPAVIQGVTAANNIDMDPNFFTVSSLSGLSRGRVISIANAGLGGTNALVTRIEHLGAGSPNYKWIITRSAASANIVGQAISAVAPTIEADLKIGRPDANAPQLTVVGGAGGSPIRRDSRTSGIAQSWDWLIGPGTYDIWDQTRARRRVSIYSQTPAIAIEVNGGMRFVEQAIDPTASELAGKENAKDRVSIYMKNDKLVISYNNKGVANYITIPLDGTTTAWKHGSIPP